MDSITRRSFVTRAAAGIAALGVVAEAPRAAEAQLVWKGSQWNLADFHTLLHYPAKVKQVFEVEEIDGGGFLTLIKNSLNELHFGFEVAENQIKIVAALHGGANMINYDDFIWNKYRIGEWSKVDDPETGKPAVRNIFYAAKHPIDADSSKQDPSDRGSMYQDTRVQMLQSRGVQFLSCHTALESEAGALVKQAKLSQTREEVVEEFMAHKLPGVLVVPSMVAAIGLLQCAGHYAYLKE